MKLVGLTGGICCGKSTVVAILRSHEAPNDSKPPPTATPRDPGLGVRNGRLGIVDCDRIAREVVRPGAWGYRRVVRAFGRSFLLSDGSLDREKLASLVFSDASARKRLNGATHLPILVRMVAEILWLWVWERRSVVVVDMPLLYEIGFQRFTSPYTVVVSCGVETQVARLQRRDGLTRAAARARVEAQMGIGEKVAMADYVLDNDEGVDMAGLERAVWDVFGAIARDSRVGVGWWVVGALGALGTVAAWTTWRVLTVARGWLFRCCGG